MTGKDNVDHEAKDEATDLTDDELEGVQGAISEYRASTDGTYVVIDPILVPSFRAATGDADADADTAKTTTFKKK